MFLAHTCNLMLGMVYAPLAKQFPQRGRILLPGVAGGVTSIGRPGRASHHQEPPFPLGVLSGGDCHITVVTGQNASDSADHATDGRFFHLGQVPGRRGPAVGAVGQAANQLGDHRFERRDIYSGALAGHAFAVESHDSRSCGGHAAHQLRLMPAGPDRRVAVRVLYRPQQAVGMAAHMVEDQVSGFEIRVGTSVAEGRDGGEDETGIAVI